MPSEKAAKCFADIVGAIDLIRAWIEKADGAEQAIRGDILIRSAVERQLLVISYAAIRLDKIDPSLAPTLAPEIDWPGVRGMGNLIRHRYDALDEEIILTVVSSRLDALRSACSRAGDAART